MLKKRILSFSIAILFFTSCGSRSVSRSDTNFNNLKIVKSQYSKLQFKIPASWIELSKTETSFFDVCVVDELYKNTVYLVPLIINFEIKLNSEFEKLKQIVYYSQLLKEAEYNISISKENVEYFNINNIQFASFEFLDDAGSKIKTVVFEHVSGPQELTFRKINLNNSLKTSFDADFVEKIILNSIQ